MKIVEEYGDMVNLSEELLNAMENVSDLDYYTKIVEKNEEDGEDGKK